MHIQGRWIVAAAAAGLFLFGGVEGILAATAPAIYSATVGKDAATDRTILTLVGRSLTKLSGFTLTDFNAAPVPGTIDTLLKSKATLVLGLPSGIPGGEYDLTTAVGAAEGPSLHLKIDSGALFQGTFGSGTIPAEGAGTRMMWYPGKAAFRAGVANGTSWDNANVGDYSAAMGFGTIASGGGSTAMGFVTTASGNYSTAMGFGTTASGAQSTAMGQTTIASGMFSTAMGRTADASGDYSTAMGFFTTAQSYGSLVLGQHNLVAGSTTTVVSTDPVLVVGNGDNPNVRSNAFTLLKNGDLTIMGTLTQASDGRLKKDVAPLAGVLRKIASIRGVTYRMKDEDRGPAGTQIGLLAQEVREVFPELVQEDSQGTLSVAYGNFSAVLLEAVKEQQAALDARDREVAALRKELADARAATEARLSRLEALLTGRPAPARDK